jgi:hypothetical protein
MGMEGKLRQVSERKLTAYRKDPNKLYSDISAKGGPTEGGKLDPMDLSVIQEAMKKFHDSPAGLRFRQCALTRLPPAKEDIEEYQKQLIALMPKLPRALAEVQADHIGLSQEGRQLSLHKSWHCLHFMFTGKTEESAGTLLGRAILGGTEIPDTNGVMPYGPVRYLAATQVKEVSEALERFPIAEKAAAFSREAAEAAGVYVPDHGAEELTEYFGMLRDFYRDAASKRNAMLLWIK